MMALKSLALVTLFARALASCGSEITPDIKALYKRTVPLSSSDSFELVSRSIIEINTYVHIISNGTTADEGYVSSEQLDQQMTVLNEVFGRYSFHFNLVDTEYLENEAWAHGENRTEMTTTLRKGSYKDLNLYFLKYMGPTNFGQCSFPLDIADFPDPATMLGMDSCMVVSNTMPGGSRPGKHDGLGAVHEVGHWFGLIHVFTDTCGDNGDMVNDTPEQSLETYGCPIGKDSCPDFPGVDSIHNYMDLSDDDCQTEFTPGQVARMHSMWATFRAPLL